MERKCLKAWSGTPPSVRVCAFALAASLAAAAAAFAACWILVDWTGEGADDHAGGVVLRDSSGSAMRVSLGPKRNDHPPKSTKLRPRLDAAPWICTFPAYAAFVGIVKLWPMSFVS